MTAGIYDTIIEQGATFSRVFTYQNNAGDAISLTGYTPRMQVRASLEAADTIFDLTDGDGVEVTDGANGEVTVTIPATDTASLTPGDRLVYDLELENGSGTVIRLVQGILTVDGEVTR